MGNLDEDMGVERCMDEAYSRRYVTEGTRRMARRWDRFIGRQQPQELGAVSSSVPGEPTQDDRVALASSDEDLGYPYDSFVEVVNGDVSMDDFVHDAISQARQRMARERGLARSERAA
jgi:hypothetical protein